jgi:hypothetical protein
MHYAPNFKLRRLITMRVVRDSAYVVQVTARLTTVAPRHTRRESEEWHRSDVGVALSLAHLHVRAIVNASSTRQQA